MIGSKEAVRAFWEDASCGERLYLRGHEPDEYERQRRLRYELEPYIVPFADFEHVAGKRVLEIGVGLGADHQGFAEGGAELAGMDLTRRAVEHTRRRLAVSGLRSVLCPADAERLPFASESFDRVYSWGVIHHSPDTQQAIREIHRVLRRGGDARVMIYHKWSLVGAMLWLRHALLRARPWTPLQDIYARHLESPGTKAYSTAEARVLFSDFATVDIATQLTHADLLSSGAGQRHVGVALSLARALWPRALLRRLFPNAGLFMLILARKQ